MFALPDVYSCETRSFGMTLSFLWLVLESHGLSSSFLGTEQYWQPQLLLLLPKSSPCQSCFFCAAEATHQPEVIEKEDHGHAPETDQEPFENSQE